MSMDLDLCTSLIRWLHTFNLQAKHSTPEEISDGVAIAEALKKIIEPKLFDEQFFSNIKTDVGSNWRLKHSNLKKILEKILYYYQDFLNQQLINFRQPDVSKIAESCDRAELGRLLQLLLGCAVNCGHKQQYITVIMGMEESVQRVIMQAIQELENGSQLSLVPSEDLQIQKLAADVDRITEEKDQLAQKCHELELQVRVLQEEKETFTQEVGKLQGRLQEAESPATGAVSSSKYGLLRREFDALKEEMFKVESMRDDARARLETQDRTVIELQTRVDELQALADEARVLKDEMDVLRETADQASKYEATIESYKRKLQELSDLKRHCKMIEDKNAGFIQINADLEEELKRQGAWKAQAEAFKKQISDLIQKEKEETNRADKLHFENKKAEEQIAALNRERERLIAERNQLKEANEELSCEVSSSSRAGNQVVGDPTTVSDLNSDLREQIAKLIKENRQLKQQQIESSELVIVKAQLEAANQQVHTLAADNRQANKKVLELENQVEGLLTRLGGPNMEQAKTKSSLQDDQIEELQRKNTQLKDALARKEVELASSEEKYKKCMEKAKTVISSLEPKQDSEALEKHKILQKLQQDRSQRSLEQENRIIYEAYHHLTGERHRESVDQRLATLSAGQSFLARQRVPVPRKLLK